MSNANKIDSTKITQKEEEEEETIMRNIENKTEKIVMTAIQTGKILNPIDIKSGKQLDTDKLLENIMRNGAKEFNNKVGRDLTYDELRQMYG